MVVGRGGTREDDAWSMAASDYGILGAGGGGGGRYVPHVVTVSLDAVSAVPENPGGEEEDEEDVVFDFDNDDPEGRMLRRRKPAPRRSRSFAPSLGRLLEAAPLDGAKASGVTCVKFSPSAEHCLLGYGVRETVSARSNAAGEGEGGDGAVGPSYHPVAALYRIRGGMTHVSTMMSGDDDVNIARFHPEVGHGFVYGTKQGRVRVLSPRPWNYYYC